VLFARLLLLANQCFTRSLVRPVFIDSPNPSFLLWDKGFSGWLYTID
jgi:hypothetical protein